MARQFFVVWSHAQNRSDTLSKRVAWDAATHTVVFLKRLASWRLPQGTIGRRDPCICHISPSGIQVADIGLERPLEGSSGACRPSLPVEKLIACAHWTAGQSVVDPCRTCFHAQNMILQVLGWCEASRVEHDRCVPTASRLLQKAPSWQMG